MLYAIGSASLASTNSTNSVSAVLSSPILPSRISELSMTTIGSAVLTRLRRVMSGERSLSHQLTVQHPKGAEPGRSDHTGISTPCAGVKHRNGRRRAPRAFGCDLRRGVRERPLHRGATTDA